TSAERTTTAHTTVDVPYGRDRQIGGAAVGFTAVIRLGRGLSRYLLAGARPDPWLQHLADVHGRARCAGRHPCRTETSAGDRDRNRPRREPPMHLRLCAAHARLRFE